MENTLKKYIEKLAFIYDLPALMVLIGDSEIVDIYSAGMSDIDKNIPCTGNEVFHAASISKLFTQAAVMKLVSDKTIDLTKSAFDYLPYLALPSFEHDLLSIERLLSHTSHIPFINCTWERSDFDNGAIKRYLEAENIKSLKPLLLKNSEFNYSDLNYEILGAVIEEVTNSSFEDFIRTEILVPIGMTGSSFIKPETVGFCPYKKDKHKNFVPVAKFPYSREHAPSSTLYTTLKDLSQAANMATSEESASLFSINKYWHEYSFPAANDVFYGHHGGDDGYSTSFCIQKNSSFRIIAAANISHAPMTAIINHILKYLDQNNIPR